MILKTGPCFTSELELNCPTIVGCVTALPLGPAAVAGTTQVLGKDGQYHTLPAAPVAAVPALSIAGDQLTIAGGNTVTLPDSDAQALSISGNVISLTNGGSVTLPTATAPDGSETKVTAGANVTVTGAGTTASPYVVTAAAAAATVFATPAQTVAGTSTTLAVNPADLYARENIAAQTGVSNDVTAIPAPTASQSPWATNALGEQLHYEPGVGWQIVAGYARGSAALSADFTPPVSSIVSLPGLTFTMPRAGKVTFTQGHFVTGSYYIGAIYLVKNGTLIRRLGAAGHGSTTNTEFVGSSVDFSGAATGIVVSAGDVFSLSGQIGWATGPARFSASLSDFSYQYNA